MQSRHVDQSSKYPGPPYWIYWPGNNRFLCCGYCMFGPDQKFLWLTISGILFPTVLICFIIIPLMCVLLGEWFSFGLLFEIVALLYVFKLWSIFFCASGIDPGIVPRAFDAPSRRNKITSEDVDKIIKIEIPPTPYYCEIKCKGERYGYKFCDSCKIYIMDKVKHCGRCDNCVENFDHHCPWLGTCIAKRNYRFFYLFLVDFFCCGVLSQFVMMVYFGVAVYWILTYKPIELDFYLRSLMMLSSPNILLNVFFIIPMFFVTCLMCFHCYLCCHNRSTFDLVRKRKGHISIKHTLQKFCSTCVTKMDRSKLNYHVRLKKKDLKYHLNRLLSNIKTMERLNIEKM